MLNTSNSYVHFDRFITNLRESLRFEPYSPIVDSWLLENVPGVFVGCKGDYVYHLASRLNDLGYKCKPSRTRTDEMKSAITLLQKDLGLPQTGIMNANCHEIRFLLEFNHST